MKIVVEGGNQEVINKLNKLGHADLEIVTESGDLTLNEKAQALFMTTTGEKDGNQMLMELIMAEHSDKFFKIEKTGGPNAMKVNAKKIKKRRAKNKMAKKSRQKSRK